MLFDPIKVINYLLNESIVDYVVVLPCYKTLNNKIMSLFYYRINMRQISVCEFYLDNKCNVCDIEKYFHNISPVEIINRVVDKHNKLFNCFDITYSFIMGIDKWPEFSKISKTLNFYVFPDKLSPTPII